MKTSTAQENNDHCPICRDELTEDIAGRGFVRHKTNADCQYGNGQKDPVNATADVDTAVAANNTN